MMRLVVGPFVFSVLLAFNASCSSGKSLSPNAEHAAPVSSDQLAPKKDFSAYRDAVMQAWFTAEPQWGRSVGYHEFDGKVADYSADGTKKHIEWLRGVQRDLSQFDSKALADDEALDLALLNGRVAYDLFDLVDRDRRRSDPTVYSELFDVSPYLNFNYAPLKQRAQRLLEHQEAALGQAQSVLSHLKANLSRPIVETAIKVYTGYAEYLRGDVKRLLANVGDDAFQARFARSNDSLAKAADDIAMRLKTEFLPRADESSHVLGVQRYRKLLKAQEGLEIELSEFKDMAEKDLARNKRAYEELMGKAKVTRPEREKLLAAATKLMEESREFVLEKEIVSIPSDDRCVLKESPPYMRWNAAFLNMAGPFDSAKQAYYYMTLPNPSWPEKEQREYIMPWGNLLATTVHEVYPGHFLHGLWIRRAPSRVQKTIESYSFVEGWAHYTEQLMVEQGFGDDDPQNRLGQLSDALLRNCRFIVSIGVHTEGMTMAEAERRFVDDCYQDKATARQQAVRSTFDPGFFAYTLGKLQILELREHLKSKLGERFSLKRFHDTLLGFGAPPVALIRERVIRRLSKD